MIFKELNKFNNVVFTEEGHTYTLNGKPLTSVTTFISKFKKPFQKEFWADKTANKEGVTRQEILDKWDSISLRACNKGSKFHAYAENYINNKILPNTIYDFDIDMIAYDTIESHFLKFYEESKDNLVPVSSELCVGSEELGLCGMVDQFSTYSLQLSTYKYIIEHETDLKIKDCYIVWFNEKNDTYKLIKCADYRKEVENMLNYN